MAKPFYYRLKLTAAGAKETSLPRTVYIQRPTAIVPGQIIAGTRVSKDGSKHEVETTDMIDGVKTPVTRRNVIAGFEADFESVERYEMNNHYGWLVPFGDGAKAGV